ncbi:hypothetical protein [Ectopseudomonas khazarica]|uniref:hypothetical protein n=1 Tax=Ectopseudomonas khazarica TaxID=2502979 RepID=UPI0037C56207
MTISLTTGVWGSFTTPRSRALGGKSGMTRATPLVSILKPRHHPAPLQFTDCVQLIVLMLLSAFLWFASIPPFDRPQVPAYFQKQACLIDRQIQAEYPDNWMRKEQCKPLT